MIYPFKVASIMTVSLKHIFELFGSNIMEMEANASIKKNKPIKFDAILKDTLGADFFSKDNNFLFLRYNNKSHDNLTSSNVIKILRVMKELELEDASVQKLVVRIKDRKLGKLCREVLSEVTEFIEKPEMPLIKRIPKDEKFFHISFFADPIEKKIVENYEEYLNGEIEKPEVEIFKPKSLKYFALNLKILINEWQTLNMLPKPIAKYTHSTLQKNLIDIEKWNWKPDSLPQAYFPSTPIIDYIKNNYLGEYKCEKTYIEGKDNIVVLNKFGR